MSNISEQLNKTTGDKLTAVEYVQVVDQVVKNRDALAALKDSDGKVKESVLPEKVVLRDQISVDNVQDDGETEVGDVAVLNFNGKEITIKGAVYGTGTTAAVVTSVQAAKDNNVLSAMATKNYVDTKVSEEATTRASQLSQLSTKVGEIDDKIYPLVGNSAGSRSILTDVNFANRYSNIDATTKKHSGGSTLSSWLISDTFKVRKGDTIKWSCYASSSSAVTIWGCPSSANIPTDGTADTRTFVPLVSPNGTSESQVERTFTATSDTYVVCQGLRSGDALKGNPTLVMELVAHESVTKDIADIEEELVNIKTETFSTFNWASGGIVCNEGVGNECNYASGGDTAFVAVKVEIKEGDKIVVTANGGNTLRAFCITDEDDIILSSAEARESVVSRTIVASEDGYLVVNARTAYSYSLSISRTSEKIKVGNDNIAEGSVSIEKLSSGVADMLNDNVPQFVKDERERVMGILVNRCRGDVSIVGFNTDQHMTFDNTTESSIYNPKYAMRGVNALRWISERIPIDAVVFGGDVASYQTGSSAFQMDGIFKAISMLNVPFVNMNFPVFNIVGNHDIGNDSAMTNSQLFNATMRRNAMKVSTLNKTSANCYYDDSTSSIRYIIVDVYTSNSNASAFLTSALQSMPSGYNALIFSHCSLSREFDDTIRIANSSGVSEPAFNGVAFQSVLNNYASQIIACISGHSHADCWAVSSSNILYVSTTNAEPGSKASSMDNIPNTATLNSVTETSFDFFVIDQTNKTIEAVRYGQGCNRKWVYKGSGIGQVSGYPQVITRTE